jgi:hypothetical protein
MVKHLHGTPDARGELSSIDNFKPRHLGLANETVARPAVEVIRAPVFGEKSVGR